MKYSTAVSRPLWHLRLIAMHFGRWGRGEFKDGTQLNFWFLDSRETKKKDSAKERNSKKKVYKKFVLQSR